MKKICTLLFTAVLFTSGFAQYNNRDQRDYSKKNDGRDVVINNDNNGYGKGYDKGYDVWKTNSFFNAEKEKNRQIAEINRQYDWKIMSVKNKFFMPRFQKERQIRFLQDQRDKEICAVVDKFKAMKYGYADYDHDRNKRHNW